MTKRELLEELKDVNPDAEIYFEAQDGCCGDTRDLEGADVRVYEPSKYSEQGSVHVSFGPLPGFYSCIQSGTTKKAHNEYWTKFNKPEYLVK